MVVETRRETVTDTFHGVEVSEDHRWLEDSSSEETRAWTAAQDAETRAYLDAVPGREAIRSRLQEILAVDSTSYDQVKRGGSTYFLLKRQPPLQQPFLVTLADLGDTAGERVLVDPNALDAGGRTTIDFFEPSPHGSRLAVSESKDRTEPGTVFVHDVETGKQVGEPLDRVNTGTAGGSLAWKHDSTGFWCTRHPVPGTVPEADQEFYQDVAYHDLDSGSFEVELTGVFADNRIAENFLSSSPDGRWVMDRVQRGDGGEWQVFVRPQEDAGVWTMLADIPEQCLEAVFGGGGLFLLSTKDAPHGQVLRQPLGTPLPEFAPDVVVPRGWRSTWPCGASLVESRNLSLIHI